MFVCVCVLSALCAVVAKIRKMMCVFIIEIGGIDKVVGRRTRKEKCLSLSNFFLHRTNCKHFITLRSFTCLFRIIFDVSFKLLQINEINLHII